jgi:acyl CoA:acetate/3-ketoacid CoA transferase alpha subunit
MEFIKAGRGKLIQPPDLNAFREWNRKKSKVLSDKRMTESEAVSRFIQDGDYIGTELYGSVRAPMSLVSEIVRQGKKDLRVAGQGVLELDLLLAASLIKELDFTYIGLELYGVSNCLRREVESGRIETIVEWSNAAITWRFKATSIGIPFIPTRSMLGTDTFEYSAALVVKDPVHRADKNGNAQIDGISGFSAELARSSKRLLISTEKIVDSEEIRAAPDRTIIPYYLVDAVVEAPFGSHPGEMCYSYRRDEPRIKDWVEASKKSETTQAYLDKYVYGVKDHREYMQLVGAERLENLRFGEV